MTSKYEYGILTKNALLKDINKENVTLNQLQTVTAGQIVKIESILAHKKYAVRILKDGETWGSTIYLCSGDSLTSVDEKFWQFLSAIVSPIERVKLGSNQARCEKLSHICKDMVVGYTSMEDVHLGTVKFIGNIKGMGKCIGLHLHVSIKDFIYYSLYHFILSLVYLNPLEIFL